MIPLRHDGVCRDISMTRVKIMDRSLTASTPPPRRCGWKRRSVAPAKGCTYERMKIMEAATQQKPPYRLDPCPADERVCDYYDVPQEYEPGTKTASEGEAVGEDGITRQRCGGGHRIIKKKIGGG